MKILITIPKRERGGVANYYQVLKKYLRKREIIYHRRGAKSNDENKIILLFRVIIEYLQFVQNVLTKNVELVLINTSLGKKSLNRDLIYILLAKILKKKVLLFIHGWNNTYEKVFFDSNHLLKPLFFKCDSYIVLSKKFQAKLLKNGVENDINLLTTIVDDNFASSNSLFAIQNDQFKILFLSRIKKEKGVLETLKAFRILKNSGDYNLKLLVAGEGSYLSEAKSFIRKYNLKDVDILGFVKGDKKVMTFKKSDLYVFPTNHGEGMPTTVLEAMAMGLPVITTPAGGIADFFQEKKMGLLLDNTEEQHIAEKVKFLIDRPELMKEISVYNYNYAKEHFYATQVANNLELIIDDLLLVKNDESA